ncbi:MAG: hypothetical protein ACXVXO_14740, partial [Mycobacteriaceae bacterium]
DLDWLLWAPQAQWVKQNVTDVEAFRATPAGERARDKVGMKALYAPGTNSLVGGWLVRDGWVFVFLLVTAADDDLGPQRNSATEIINSVLQALASEDPHNQASRNILHAHALDRVLRAELFAWQVFHVLTATYVLVDAAGRSFDALAPNAKDEWTFIVFGASRGRDDTARRFLIHRLNTARAGNWPGNVLGLPIGYRPTAEPDDQGKWNLHPDDKQCQVNRPVPDPAQRWAVNTIAHVFADPSVTSWTAAARACGHAGITARGTDELGQPLHHSRDLTSAGKLLITPLKIRAYSTGLLRHTETGVTDGQFTPGDGHRLLPRFPGDKRGACTFDVRVGLPSEHGWDWGVTDSVWAEVLRRWWLPDAFTPEGWTWDQPAADWDWDQILESSKKPSGAPVGRHAADARQRPFSGLLRWTDPDGAHRNLVYARSEGDGRYEWRRELMAHAKRDQRGNRRRMASTDGAAVCSWTQKEFHEAYATLLQDAMLSLISDVPELASTRLTAAAHTPAAPDPVGQRRRDVARLRSDAAEHQRNARALRLTAAQLTAKGDASPDNYLQDAQEEQKLADEKDEQAAELEASPLPAPAGPPAPETADFGTPALVIAALTGTYQSGAAPVALQTALVACGAKLTRLDVVDASTVQMTVTATVAVPTGQRTATRTTLLGRSAARRKGQPAHSSQRKADLARRWYYDGVSPEELLLLARSTSWDTTLRSVQEYLATGAARTVGQGDLAELSRERIPSVGLRHAITHHPVAAARASLWCDLEGEPLPDGIDQHYAQLISSTFRSEHDWTKRRVMLDQTSDHRQDLMTVLAAQPDPSRPMQTNHLGALAGVDGRHITTVSASLTRGIHTIPASLIRSHGFGLGSGNAPAHLRTVRLPACPWSDCDSGVADGLLLLPELLLGCATTGLCRTCLRPPTRNITFPDAYRDLLDAQPHRTGTWVRCASGCDLGAGRGLLWRWDDTAPSAPSGHHACM